MAKFSATPGGTATKMVYTYSPVAVRDDDRGGTSKERPQMIKSQASILSTISEKRDKVLWFFNDMRVYIALELISDIFMGVVSGYYWAMITSIEKEFQFTGVKLGFLSNAYDIGRLPILPLLSFFGGRGHIPRIMGFMQLVRAAAIAMLVLPHFIFGENVIALLKASAEESATTAEEQALAVGNYSYETTICHPPRHNATVDRDALTEDLMRNSDYAYGMFIASYVLFGISFAAPGTIGMMYLDNNFDKSKMPLLIGIKTAVIPIGPFFGSLLGAWFSTIYVDLSEPSISLVDPKWISAWWLGLIIAFIPPTIIGPLICLFPRRMRKKGTINMDIACITKRLAKTNPDTDRKNDGPKKERKRLSEAEKHVKEELEKERASRDMEDFKKSVEETYTIKMFPRTLLSLLTNPVFMMLVLYRVLEDFAWSGWSSFAMKYYEHIFRVPPWKVMTINTVANVLVGPMGSLIGGIVIVRLRPTFARAALLMILTIMVWCFIGIGRMFITCGDSTYAGLNYTGPEQLMGDCNAGCECNLEAFSPVCDNGLTYFSPCHAGCQKGNITMANGVIQPHLKDYFECNCTHSSLASPGKCEGECDLVYLYVGLRGVSMLVWAVTGSATTLMLIRSVSYSQKAFGLGTNMFVAALLGSMPSSPLIGKIMDTTCTVWQYIRGEQGNCWIHDPEQMRFRLYGWTLGFMTLQCLVLLIVYFLAKRKNLKLFEEDDPMVLEKRQIEAEAEATHPDERSVVFSYGYRKDSNIPNETRL